jgi:hypothetical protein
MNAQNQLLLTYNKTPKNFNKKLGGMLITKPAPKNYNIVIKDTIVPTASQTKPLVGTRLGSNGYTKGYGNKCPKEGTSAYAIWQACIELKVVGYSNTKLVSAQIASLNLQCNKGAVNPNNIAIEVNSYKRWLDHDVKKSA